jgi:hypothetical protein
MQQHGEGKNAAYNILLGNSMVRNHLRDLSIDRKMILEFTIEKSVVRMSTRLTG